MVALALPVFASSRWAWLQERPDSPTVAAEWIREHVERETETVLVGYLLAMPLPGGDPPRRGLSPLAWRNSRSRWEEYEEQHLAGRGAEIGYRLRVLHVPSPRLELRKRDILKLLEQSAGDYAVVAVPNPQRARRDHTIEAVRAFGGKLLVRIAPYESPTLAGTTIGARDDFGYEALAVALFARRTGPIVEIYALPREAKREASSSSGLR